MNYAFQKIISLFFLALPLTHTEKKNKKEAKYIQFHDQIINHSDAFVCS